MKKTLPLFLILLIISGLNAFCEEKFSFDGCENFDIVYEKSENLVASVATEAEQASFTEDFTFFQRTALSPEYIVYKTDEDLTVSTYFWGGEQISHFNFYISADGKSYMPVKPGIKQYEKVEGKWDIIDYTVRQKGTEFVKIEFSNLAGNSWNPAIRYVKAGNTAVSEELYDIRETELYEKVRLLERLGIMGANEDKSFSPDTEMTRGEFAQLCVRLQGKEELMPLYGGYTYFRDVDGKSGLAPYVNYLAESGVISAGTDFLPDNAISYAEAVKMLVSVMGYRPLAEIKGGYPNGYMYAAAELKLPGFERITRGAAAFLAAHLLEQKIFEQETFGETAEFSKAHTLLYDSFGISVFKGNLTDNGISSITGESRVKNTQAVVGNVIYTCREDMTDYLGYRLKIYVKDDEIVHFENITDEEITLYAKDGLTLYGSRLETEVEKADINSEMRIIYNGEFLGKAADVNLKNYLPESGWLRIVGEDIIHIKSYDTVIAYADASLEKSVFDRFGGEYQVNAKDAEILNITRDGEKTDSLKIYANEVVSVAKSLGGKVIDVIITNDAIISTADKIGGDSLFLNGTEYKLSGYFTDNVTVNAGDSGDFYFDFEGKIAWCDIENNEVYAYVIKMSQPDAMSGETELKALSGDGIRIFRVKKDAPGAESLGEGKLFTLKVNKWGLVSKITEARLDFEGTSTLYGTTFASLYGLKNETEVFVIPQDLSYDYGYRMANKSAFLHTRVYNIKIYDSDEKYEPEAIVVYENGSELNPVVFSSPMMVVTSAATALNADGNPAVYIEGYENGEKKEYFISAERGKVDIGFDGYTDKCVIPGETGDKIKPGDIVQFALDSKGEITDIRFLYKSGETAFYEWAYGNAVPTEQTRLYGDVIAFFGKAEKRFPGKIIAESRNGWKRSFDISSAKVYVFENGRILPADETDIKEGDSVFCAVQASAVTAVLVVR